MNISFRAPRPGWSPPAPVLVAIDGPAGSGKSSVARAAADELGFGILDTGAAYRALTWAALASEIDLDDPDTVLALAQSSTVVQTLVGEPTVTAWVPGVWAGADITRAIRDPDVSSQVSRVSKHAAVRELLNARFHETVAASGLPGVVIEGRDITTVVAPDAPVRVLMTASPEVRARRRAGELAGTSMEQVLADIVARDARDAQVVDFVNPAPGVVLVDTSEMSFEQSVAAVVELVRVAQAASAKVSDT